MRHGLKLRSRLQRSAGAGVVEIIAVTNPPAGELGQVGSPAPSERGNVHVCGHWPSPAGAAAECCPGRARQSLIGYRSLAVAAPHCERTWRGVTFIALMVSGSCLAASVVFRQRHLSSTWLAATQLTNLVFQWNQNSSRMTRRRYVYHLPDTVRSRCWYRVFKRELATFARNGTSALKSEPSPQPATSSTHCKSRLRAHWRVETGYGMLGVGDIILSDLRGRSPDASRIVPGLPRYHADGSAVRYFKATGNMPFLSVPFVLLLVFLVVGRRGRPLVATSLLSSYRAAGCSFVTLTAAIFIALLRWPGQRWSVQHGLKTGFFRGITCTSPA